MYLNPSTNKPRWCYRLTHNGTDVSRVPARAVAHHGTVLLVHTRPAIHAHFTGAAVDGLGDVRFAIFPRVVRGAAAEISPGGIFAGTSVQTEVWRKVLAFVNVISAVSPTPPCLADTHKTFRDRMASLCVPIFTRGTEAVVSVFAIGPRVFCTTYTLVRICLIEKTTTATVLTRVRQTEGVVLATVCLTPSPIKPRTTYTFGVGAVITAISIQVALRYTRTGIQAIERFTGVVEIFAVVPCSPRGALTLVVMAPLYFDAVSRSTGIGVTDIERLCAVLALVS